MIMNQMKTQVQTQSQRKNDKVMGGCRNSFLVFVSDRSRSGLAKKSVQILDSLP